MKTTKHQKRNKKEFDKLWGKGDIQGLEQHLEDVLKRGKKRREAKKGK